MAQPYLGSITIFAGNFAPLGYAFCRGQLLGIAQNDALFALLGTTYGGDGINTFALPDLRGRLPIHQGQGPGLTSRVIGQMSGTETVTLTTPQMPAHSHAAFCNAGVGVASPANGVWALSNGISGYGTAADVTMNSGCLTSAGGSQPHENRMPLLAINFIIALQGVFPQSN